MSCLAYYGYKQVGEALSITDKTVRNWEKAFNRSSQTKRREQEPEFVPISLSHASPTIQSLSILSDLQLTLPSGLVINMTHQNTKEAMAFIMQLNKELSSCSI